MEEGQIAYVHAAEKNVRAERMNILVVVVVVVVVERLKFAKVECHGLGSKRDGVGGMYRDLWFVVDEAGVNELLRPTTDDVPAALQVPGEPLL